jgi:hypothetical protein
MWHITQAKRAIKQLLHDELPAALAEADAQADDGITTPPPYEIHTTDKTDLGGLPSVEIVTAGSASGSDSVAQIYRHRLLVGVSVGGDDEETISVQAERYLWTLRQVLRDKLLPGIGTSPLETGSEQYTPIVQRPGGVEFPFVKGCFLEVTVPTLELPSPGRFAFAAATAARKGA